MRRIVKSSLGQEATTLLRRMLLDGLLGDGERLVEDRIATELGISRTPLREALHRLAQEGLLEKRRAGGYALRKLDPRAVEDAIDIRSMLESHAAELAAQRATESQMTSLQANQEMFRAANTDQDIPALVDLNTEFHSILRQAAHSPLLLQMLSELDGVVDRMLRRMLSQQELDWSAKDHLTILTQIMARDAAGAAAAMRQHVKNGKQKVLDQLREKVDD